MGSSGYKAHKKKCECFDAYTSIKTIFELMQLYKNFNNISFKAFLISTKSIPLFMNIIKNSNILNYLNNKNINKNYLKNQEENLNDLLSSYILEDNIKIYYDYNELKQIIKDDDEKENEFIIVDELFCRIMKINDYFYEHIKHNISINKSIMIIEADNYSDQFYFTQKENGIYKFINRSN
jgi:hypothetical protein